MKRTPIEIAVFLCIAGTVAATAVPTCARNIRFSRFAEAQNGLSRLVSAEIAYAVSQGTLSPSAPLTPSEPPRGVAAADAPATWDAPSWTVLRFRGAEEGEAHWFSYSLDTTTGTTFVAAARGDLDGDGNLSLFERRGTLEGARLIVEPGLYTENEFE